MLETLIGLKDFTRGSESRIKGLSPLLIDHYGLKNKDIYSISF